MSITTVEKLLLGLTLLGIALLIARVPEAMLLLLISSTLLAGLYLLFNFPLLFGHPIKGLLQSDAYRQASSNRKIGAAGLGYALSMVVMGVLLAHQGQSSRTQLLIGTTLSFVAMILAIIRRGADSTGFYSRVLSRAAPAVAIGGSVLVLLAR